MIAQLCEVGTRIGSRSRGQSGLPVASVASTGSQAQAQRRQSSLADVARSDHGSQDQRLPRCCPGICATRSLSPAPLTSLESVLLRSSPLFLSGNIFALLRLQPTGTEE